MFKAIMSSFGTVGVLIVVVALLVVMPFLTIWSVNTLFPSISILYTWETWLATILLGMFFRGSSASVSSK